MVRYPREFSCARLGPGRMDETVLIGLQFPLSVYFLPSLWMSIHPQAPPPAEKRAQAQAQALAHPEGRSLAAPACPPLRSAPCVRSRSIAAAEE